MTVLPAMLRIEGHTLKMRQQKHRYSFEGVWNVVLLSRHPRAKRATTMSPKNGMATLPRPYEV